MLLGGVWVNIASLSWCRDQLLHRRLEVWSKFGQDPGTSLGLRGEFAEGESM